MITIRKQTKTWKTRDGRKIRLCDMTIKHLKNTARMLERLAENAKFNTPYPCFQGEMAQMCAEQEWDNFMEQDTEDFFPIYGDIMLEIQRREQC